MPAIVYWHINVIVCV